ncbi:MAG: CBS domain-containing protein [Planctomycetes bacterium]|nr:CBS domain-containing protein [Planctomycetota bacterium]
MKAKRESSPVDLESLCAADVMQRELVTVQASDSIEEVERIIADAKVSGVPVIGDGGRIIGILSTSDLVSRYAADDDHESPHFDTADEDEDDELVDYEPDSNRVCAADVMTPEIQSIPSSTPLREVARRMADGEIHRLLVVDQGRLVGLVSTLDVIRAIAR